MIKSKQVKNSLIKIFILLVFILLNMTTKNVKANDEVEKFDDFEEVFFETPTRFIFIEDEAPKSYCPPDSCRGGWNSPYMVYYEINKQTGKVMKLKGRTLNAGHYGRLLGYTFKNKDYVYAINLGRGGGLSIRKKLGKGKYDYESPENVDEPIIEYQNITRNKNAKQSY